MDFNGIILYAYSSIVIVISKLLGNLPSEHQLLSCGWKKTFYLLLMCLVGSFCSSRFRFPSGISVYDNSNFNPCHMSWGSEPWRYVLSQPWFMIAINACSYHLVHKVSTPVKTLKLLPKGKNGSYLISLKVF